MSTRRPMAISSGASIRGGPIRRKRPQSCEIEHRHGSRSGAGPGHLRGRRSGACRCGKGSSPARSTVVVPGTPSRSSMRRSDQVPLAGSRRRLPLHDGHRDRAVLLHHSNSRTLPAAAACGRFRDGIGRDGGAVGSRTTSLARPTRLSGPAAPVRRGTVRGRRGHGLTGGTDERIVRLRRVVTSTCPTRGSHGITVVATISTSRTSAGTWSARASRHGVGHRPVSIAP